MTAIKSNFYRQHDRVEATRARKQGQSGAKAALEKRTKIIVIFMTFLPIEKNMQH